MKILGKEGHLSRVYFNQKNLEKSYVTSTPHMQHFDTITKKNYILSESEPYMPIVLEKV